MDTQDERMPSEKERARRLNQHLQSRPPLLGHQDHEAGISAREALRARHGYDGAARIIRRMYDLAEGKGRRGKARNAR